MLILPETVPSDFKGHWVPDLQNELYHADKTAVSSTSVRQMMKSPLNFYSKFVLGERETATEAMNFGTAAHMFFLQPDKFRETYWVMPEFTGRTKDGRESTQSAQARDEKKRWYLDLPPGAKVVSQGDLDALMGMLESLGRHKIAKSLIEGAAFEQSGYFRDPVTGLKCRIRPDILRTDLSAMPDFKTTRDISSEFFSKEIWNYRYDVQMAFYSLGVKQIMGKEPENPCFIAVENKAPYDVAVYACDEGMMDRGMNAVRKSLNRIAECLEKSEWPGYQPDGAENISLPTFTDWIAE